MAVAVVGGGLVGLATAWRLQRRGHQVQLIEAPDAPEELGGCPTALRGSRAALGLLMAQVFHRSSGRAWRLRQQSLALWSQWRHELAERGQSIPWRPGLLLLAADPEELQRQQRLLADPARRQLALQLWGRERLEALQPAVPAAALGGLYSAADGQLDAQAAMAALAADAAAAGLITHRERVAALESRARAPGGRWWLALEAGGGLEADWVVLSAGLGGNRLLEPLGLAGASPWRVEPVLGQALELERALDAEAGPQAAAAWTWPGAVSWRGINLVPRPDLANGRRFWLGATLEPGTSATAAALEGLRQLEGAAPEWLRQAREVRRWQGLRPRPVGRPAPLLEALAPGLLLAGGHYRNGVLLAPASAAWVAEQVEGASA